MNQFSFIQKRNVLLFFNSNWCRQRFCVRTKPLCLAYFILDPTLGLVLPSWSLLDNINNIKCIISQDFLINKSFFTSNCVQVVRETGPPHMRTFITKCVVGDLVTEGEGNGKKVSFTLNVVDHCAVAAEHADENGWCEQMTNFVQVSKKKAAELMLDQLRQVGVMVVSIQFYFFSFCFTILNY